MKCNTLYLFCQAKYGKIKYTIVFQVLQRNLLPCAKVGHFLSTPHSLYQNIFHNLDKVFYICRNWPF